MAKTRDVKEDFVTSDGTEYVSGETVETEKPKVHKDFRPLFNEIARLSATLGIARKACYTGDADRAANALALLGRQLELAGEMAGLFTRSEE